MKKIFIAVAALIILSCNSGNKKTSSDTNDQNQVGVPNTDGTLPDTTNAINLSTHKKDTTQKDSSK